jgi:hypothetical protein
MTESSPRGRTRRFTNQCTVTVGGSNARDGTKYRYGALQSCLALDQGFAAIALGPDRSPAQSLANPKLDVRPRVGVTLKNTY